MKKKLRVAVLMGGNSPEYEVSLASGREVVRHLDPQKYGVLPVVILRDGKHWEIVRKEKLLHSPAGVVEKKIKIANCKLPIENKLIKKDGNFLSSRGDGKIDLVFIALHGSYGEDGRVQGMLEVLGLPYTGSGILASALGMNKVASRKLWRESGLTVPHFEVVRSKAEFKKIIKNFSFPVVVKPASCGSSVGVNIIHNRKETNTAFKEAITFDDEILIEEYIPGREVTCGILGNESPAPLPLVEIVPKQEFFNYKAKYDPDFCEEIVPARISPELSKKIQETAVCAYKILGCAGFGRVDMILGKNGKIYLLELNTIPGLTKNSLLPKAAKAFGLDFPQLLGKIIEYASQKTLSSGPKIGS